MSTDIQTGAPPKKDLQASWLWLVAGGVLMFAAGMFAFYFLFAATIASVLVFAATLIVGGVGQIIHAFTVRGAGHFLYWLLGGLLYALGGVFAFMNPILASAVLTLMLGITFIILGIVRIVSAFDTPKQRGWLIFGGVVTALVGLMITFGWPMNTIWVIGLFLAVDLIYQGIAWMVTGFALKRST